MKGVQPGSITDRVLQLVPAQKPGLLHRELVALLNAQEDRTAVSTGMLSVCLSRMVKSGMLAMMGQHAREFRYYLRKKPEQLRAAAKPATEPKLALAPAPAPVKFQTSDEWIAAGNQPEILPPTRYVAPRLLPRFPTYSGSHAHG